MLEPIVDIGILTIRDGEFRTVMERFGEDQEAYRGLHRENTFRAADAGQGLRSRVAVTLAIMTWASLTVAGRTISTVLNSTMALIGQRLRGYGSP